MLLRSLEIATVASNDTRQGATKFATLVARVMARVCGEKDERLTIKGDLAQLGKYPTVLLTLAPYELVANSVNHGVLSVPSGHVSVSWAFGQEDGAFRFRLDWREAGGPMIHRPDRRGFGSRLIDQLAG